MHLLSQEVIGEGNYRGDTPSGQFTGLSIEKDNPMTGMGKESGVKSEVE